MARVLLLASEAVPYSKSGGLGDVIGSLAPALAAHDVEPAILVPAYEPVRDGVVTERFDVWLGHSAFAVSLFESHRDDGVRVYLAGCPELFERQGLYGDGSGDYPDNHVRFAVLCRTALALLGARFRAQVVHCHDWQTALLPVYLRTDPEFRGLDDVKTVFTIHNLAYQGILPGSALLDVGLDRSLFHMDALEFWGNVSLLKGGIVFADVVTTVSPTYAREIQMPEFGFGLDGLLRARQGRLHGILNGVDYTVWNPAHDPHVAATFAPDCLEGKAACKADLLASFGLPAESGSMPLAGIVSRLVDQKGFDLIAETLPRMLDEGLCVVALGTGESRYEQLLRDFSAKAPGRVGVRIGFDERLTHKIEAGADLFLMPSRYEPCGLNQMYSLRYGTLPVVHAVGGLNDTVDGDTGFKFTNYSPEGFLAVLQDAVAVFTGEPERWTAMVQQAMRRDHSWGASAGEYATLYRMLIDEPR